MNKVFSFFTILFLSVYCFSQDYKQDIIGNWKVNYFASGNEITASFPENLLMEYQFAKNGQYVYSVTDVSTKSRNEQKGTYQILNETSIILSIEDIKMVLLVFRFTNQELVFKTEV